MTTTGAQDCTGFLAELTQEYERSCALLSELERGLQEARASQRPSSHPAPVKATPETREADSKNPSYGIKTNLARFFLRKSTSRQTMTGEPPELGNNTLRRPSVVNLGGERLDDFTHQDELPRRATSFKGQRRSVLVWQPSLPDNCAAQTCAGDGQALAEPVDVRLNSPVGNQPVRMSGAATEAETRSFLAESSPTAAAGSGKVGLPRLTKTQADSCDNNSMLNTTPRGLNLVYANSVLVAPAGNPTAPGVLRSQSMRARSFTRRGSEHDSVLQQLQLSGGSVTGTTPSVTRRLNARPVQAFGPPSQQPPSSSSGGGALLPSLKRNQSSKGMLLYGATTASGSSTAAGAAPAMIVTASGRRLTWTTLLNADSDDDGDDDDNNDAPVPEGHGSPKSTTTITLGGDGGGLVISSDTGDAPDAFDSCTKTVSVPFPPSSDFSGSNVPAAFRTSTDSFNLGGGGGFRGFPLDALLATAPAGFHSLSFGQANSRQQQLQQRGEQRPVSRQRSRSMPISVGAMAAARGNRGDNLPVHLPSFRGNTADGMQSV